MATTIINLPASALIPDNDANLVAGDNPAQWEAFNGRLGLTFDDIDEEAALSPEMVMPQGVSGTLSAIIHFFMKSDASNDIALDVFVEAKTPNNDTLDMESADSWDSANSGTKSLGGTTAGDPLTLSITLTNKDSVAAGDLFRIGVRRDCDSGNDDASGDLVITAIEIQEA